MKTVPLALALLWRTTLVYLVLVLLAMLASAVLHGAGVDIVSPEMALSAAFIRAKPTIAYTLFAAALLIAEYVFRANLVRQVWGRRLPLTLLGWRRLTGGLVMLLLSLATLNSIVASKFSIEWWVNYRLFGALSLFVLGHVLLAHLLRRQAGTLQGDRLA